MKCVRAEVGRTTIIRLQKKKNSRGASLETPIRPHAVSQLVLYILIRLLNSPTGHTDCVGSTSSFLLLSNVILLFLYERLSILFYYDV